MELFVFFFLFGTMSKAAAAVHFRFKMNLLHRCSSVVFPVWPPSLPPLSRARLGSPVEPFFLLPSCDACRRRDLFVFVALVFEAFGMTSLPFPVSSMKSRTNLSPLHSLRQSLFSTVLSISPKPQEPPDPPILPDPPPMWLQADNLLTDSSSSTVSFVTISAISRSVFPLQLFGLRFLSWLSRRTLLLFETFGYFWRVFLSTVDVKSNYGWLDSLPPPRYQNSSCRGQERSFSPSSFSKERTLSPLPLSLRGALLLVTMLKKLLFVLTVLSSYVMVCTGPEEITRSILVLTEVMDHVLKSQVKLTTLLSVVTSFLKLGLISGLFVLGRFEFVFGALSNFYQFVFLSLGCIVCFSTFEVFVLPFKVFPRMYLVFCVCIRLIMKWRKLIDKKKRSYLWNRRYNHIDCM